jgi:hypothetical protein
VKASPLSFVFCPLSFVLICGFETSFGTSPTEVKASPLSFVHCLHIQSKEKAALFRAALPTN